MDKDRRSKVDGNILDEVLKENGTAVNRNGDLKGLQQYQTPRDLAYQLVLRLNINYGQSIYDPQCAYGNLLKGAPWASPKFGVELDPEAAQSYDGQGSYNIVEGSTPKFNEVMNELVDGHWCVDFAVANPPFGFRWDGIDSTEWTLRHCIDHANKGMLIGNASTIERLGLDKWDEVTSFETREEVWNGVDVVAGILFWERKPEDKLVVTRPGILAEEFATAATIVKEEKRGRKWNFWLDSYGRLQTYLSTRLKMTEKITPETARNLLALEGQSPMSLAGDFKARRIMQEMIDAGLYVIEPDCKAQIEIAIIEAASSEVPIMPVTDFELVAYAENDGFLKCSSSTILVPLPETQQLSGETLEQLTAFADDPTATEEEVIAALDTIHRMNCVETDGLFTVGKQYTVDSETYEFCEKYDRDKVHLDSDGRTYSTAHHCELKGRERKIILRDNNGDFHEFLDRPDPKAGDTRSANGRDYKVYAHPERVLWNTFTRPVVDTVAEAFPDLIAYHHEVMDNLEMAGGFTYLPGQRTYLARFACKNFGLPAAETGVGKTLLAISVAMMKGAERPLIIAPQGTVRGEDAQWISEINFFAPWAEVRVFCDEEELNAHRGKNGVLPKGFYITYYECMFNNQSQEFAPKTWTSKNIYQFIDKQYVPDMQEHEHLNGRIEIFDANNHKEWVEGMGECGRLHMKKPFFSKANGIKCLATPCLAETYQHEFDMVIADEAHKACNLNSQLTDAMIRMQPKYKFAFTATPIPDRASNLFSLLGWLCVPNWYKGGESNAAFPYRREDMGRFCDNFLSNERDLTAEDIAIRNDKARPKPKHSPILSSPARLLKLIKPTVAYVSKPDCCPDYRRPEVVDVRVPMGLQQGKLYAHFMERGNIDHDNPMTRAGIQIAVLRAICAEPMSSQYNGPDSTKHNCFPCSDVVTSQFNPKLRAILELCRDFFDEGRQVVIVNARLDLTAAIASCLEQCGVPFSRIDSELGANKASAQASAFKKKKTKVLLMGIKCAQAYSFDQCDRLIVGSTEYTYGSFEQAKGRIDRITSRSSKIYTVLVKASIEETVYDAVSTKQDSATICLQGKRVPRHFKPVDLGELLAKSLDKFDKKALVDEIAQTKHWPALRAQISNAHKGINTTQVTA